MRQEYINKLVNKIFILLPIYEGRDHASRSVTYGAEIAFNNYINSLNKLKIEISGFSKNNPQITELIEVLNILEGLKDIGWSDEEHEILRQNIFTVIDVVKKIAANYPEE